MHEPEQVLTQFLLPWWTVEGELTYQVMTLASDSAVDRRKSMRLVRKWYKDTIGRKVDKETLDRVWARRRVQRAMTPDQMAVKLHEAAGRLDEEPNTTQGYNDSPCEETT